MDKKLYYVKSHIFLKVYYRNKQIPLLYIKMFIFYNKTETFYLFFGTLQIFIYFSQIFSKNHHNFFSLKISKKNCLFIMDKKLLCEITSLP